jgi:hypothetical protein
MAPCLSGQTTDGLEVFAVLLVATVGKIKPSDIETCFDELAQDRLVG